MRKYNVYGIGNALTDMVFEVSEEKLLELGVDKGVMTLIDEARLNTLLSALDLNRAKKTCGGSAANTMIAVAQFGGRSFYSCKVAKDDFGRFYYNDLKHEGVDANDLPDCKKSERTGMCLVMVTPDAERTMNTYLGATSTFSKEQLVESALAESDYLYIEGYLVPSPTGKEASILAYNMAKQHGVKTALSFSDPNMVKYFKDGLLQMIGDGVDILFCNNQEALDFSKTTNLEDAVREMKQYAKSFAITLGSKGALIYDGRDCFEVASVKVNALDTNGAGDMFAGAFLYGLTNGYAYKAAAELACHAASKVVSVYGPRISRNVTQSLLIKVEA